MLARSHGTIISTTFLSGAEHVPFTTSSSVTQSAIIRFHHGLNDEVLPKGIYSYVVHPGLIASHLHDPEAKVDSSHFALEPRMQSEMTSHIEEAMQDRWCGAGRCHLILFPLAFLVSLSRLSLEDPSGIPF